MRFTFIGLAAALYWTGAFSATPARGDSSAEMDVVVGRRLVSRMNGRHRNATSGFAELGLRQANAQCGAQGGRCSGDLCCSSYGFCGDSIDHCHPLFDCQPQYGVCGWPRTPAQPTTSSTTTSIPPPSTTSTTVRPPITSTSTTPVIPPTSTTTSTIPIPTGPLVATTNGMCGNSTVCIGNPNYGPCCSQFFWCGSSLEFCGAGCQSQFGACFGVPGQPGGPVTNGTITTTGAPPTSTSTSISTAGPITTTSTTTTRITTTSTTSSAPATPTVVIPPGMRSSTDGKCGNNVTCLGANFGRCCSQFGYCGDGDQFCPYIVGCQPEFGYCEPR